MLDALSGSDLGTLNTAGFPTPQQTYTLDQVGFADDGTLYVGNLMAAAGDQFSLVQYAAPISVGASANFQSYGPGDPGAAGGDAGDRWGDTMSVRGSGTNTQILLGSGNGTNVLLFTTVDGETFTPNLIPISGLSPTAAAPSANAIAFGAGNTFWIKGGHNYDLRECSFDPVGLTATVIEDYAAGTPAPPNIPNNMAGLAVDPVNNILAGVCIDDTPHDLQLFLLSGNTNIPTLFDQAFFGSVNPNGNEDAAVSRKFPYAFGLDANNGIVAVKYGVPTAGIPSFSVTATRAGGTVVLSWSSAAGHTYNVLSSATLTTARSTWTTITSSAQHRRHVVGTPIPRRATQIVLRHSRRNNRHSLIADPPLVRQRRVFFFGDRACKFDGRQSRTKERCSSSITRLSSAWSTCRRSRARRAGKKISRPSSSTLSPTRGITSRAARMPCSSKNFGDAPFTKSCRRPGNPVARRDMAAAGCAVRAAVKLPIGFNVLRATMRVRRWRCARRAAAISASAVNVHSGAMLTDQGIIEGNAYETLRYREGGLPRREDFCRCARQTRGAPG